jgi:cell division protein FtsW
MSANQGRIDWYILTSVILLMLFSIAFVYSASYAFAEAKFGSEEKLFISHLVRVALGIITLLVFSKIDYHVWMRISKFLLIIAVFLLIAVLLVGLQKKGSARWLDLGFISFQPSEFAKFALVIHLASLLHRKQAIIKDFKEGLLPLLIWTVGVCFLIILQPDNSTAMVIFAIAIAMIFIGNANLLHLGAIAGGLSFLGILYAFFVSGYPLERLKAFFGMSDTTAELERLGYQLKQSLIALGNGGFFGVGPGQSKQSNLFLPESYGDFIYSIIGEEYGFIGAVFIILVFILIFWRGMIISKHAPDTFGYFLAIGIIITFSLYAFINAGVNCGLLPTTGLPMPFVSYGGTAILFHAAAIGILLNISAQAGVYPKNNLEYD